MPLDNPDMRGEMADEGHRRDNSRLDQQDVLALAAYGAAARWPVGFSIYETGTPADGIFIVLRGQVVLRSRVKAGRGFVPALITPGETFGAEGLGDEGHYRTDARAETEAETLHLSSARFRSLMRERPQDAFPLLGQAFAERAQLLQRLSELAASSVEQRLVGALLRLSAAREVEHRVLELQPSNGRPLGGGGSWSGSGSGGGANGTPSDRELHSEPLHLDPARYRLLCEMVGATRESVSLVMARLVAEGGAVRDGNSILIPSPYALLRRGRSRGDTPRELKVEREPELSA